MTCNHFARLREAEVRLAKGEGYQMKEKPNAVPLGSSDGRTEIKPETLRPTPENENHRTTDKGTS